MTGDEDFSKYPVSISERRNVEAKDWTPREAVISLLREIDSKNFDLKGLVIIFAQEEKDGTRSTGYRCATPDVYTTIGLIEIGKLRIQEDAVS